MIRALPIMLAVLVTACTAVEERPPVVAPAEPLVWPQPPEKPRIKFLYAFRDAKDLGFSEPFFKRLWSIIAGKKERGMVRPYAIAAEGPVVAVVDPGVRVVHLFDMAAKKYKRIRKVGKDFLVSPVGVGVSADRVYISDSSLEKVFVFNTSGDYLFSIEDLARPTGLAFDQDTGRLYVADTLDHRIVVFDQAGKKLFSFGKRGEGSGTFNFPTHLFLRADKLYVNDTMNFRIQAFDLDGQYLSSFGTHGDGSGHFAQPKGVGVDEEGHIYVVDAAFNRVQVFDSGGKYLLSFGAQGGKAGNFWLPSGLFIAKDRIYVADSYNRRIQVFQFIGGG
jgi:DNA-binding beta-propeller fold protein YncE